MSSAAQLHRRGAKLTSSVCPLDSQLRTGPREETGMENVILWLWRLMITVIIAFGVWGIWWQTVQLEALNGELIELIDDIRLESDSTE